MRFFCFALFFFCFQKGKLFGKKKQKKSCTGFHICFFQDVETACSFKLHLSIRWDCIHLSCTATDLFVQSTASIVANKLLSHSGLMGYYLYSVVSLLHVHSLSHMDFLNTEKKHRFEEARRFVSRSHRWVSSEHTQSLVCQIEADDVESSATLLSYTLYCLKYVENMYYSARKAKNLAFITNWSPAV